MKKLLFIIGVVLAIVGCEKVDMFGRKYSEYPIAGKSYVSLWSENVSKDFDLYTFNDNGECNVDYYVNHKYTNDGIYDYFWWMEGDSIYIDTEPERTYKFLSGAYYGHYIILNNKKMELYKK